MVDHRNIFEVLAKMQNINHYNTSEANTVPLAVTNLAQQVKMKKNLVSKMEVDNIIVISDDEKDEEEDVIKPLGMIPQPAVPVSSLIKDYQRCFYLILATTKDDLKKFNHSLLPVYWRYIRGEMNDKSIDILCTLLGLMRKKMEQKISCANEGYLLTVELLDHLGVGIDNEEQFGAFLNKIRFYNEKHFILVEDTSLVMNKEQYGGVKFINKFTETDNITLCGITCFMSSYILAQYLLFDSTVDNQLAIKGKEYLAATTFLSKNITNMVNK